MRFTCDSGYKSVGLHDFFQKGICSLSGGVAAWRVSGGGAGSLSRAPVSCAQHWAPARLPVAPERKASRSHCGAQWVSSGMVPRPQCRETVLVVPPGGRP